MSQSIIKVNQLKKVFEIKQKPTGKFATIRSILKPSYKEITAVNNISFEVKSGEMLAFIGPNGAGKSTTIKMLTGILYPTSGEISVLGYNPSEDRTKLAYHIGSVFGQKSQLWYHLPALDTYQLLSKLYELDYNEYQERLQFLVKIFEIEDYLTTPVRKLSLGQRMRCELVASLLHKPKILFLDEPTIGLDVIAKQQVRETLKLLNKHEGVTIFLTSHDAGDIEAITNRTIIINHGTIVFDNSTETLKKNYITTKLVNITTEELTTKFDFPQGHIVEQTSYNLKIEIDTKKTAIKDLLDYALKNFTVLDITIADTSLETIISKIYQEQRQELKGEQFI